MVSYADLNQIYLMRFDQGTANEYTFVRFCSPWL